MIEDIRREHRRRRGVQEMSTRMGPNSLVGPLVIAWAASAVFTISPDLIALAMIAWLWRHAPRPFWSRRGPVDGAPWMQRRERAISRGWAFWALMVGGGAIPPLVAVDSTSLHAIMEARPEAPFVWAAAVTALVWCAMVALNYLSAMPPREIEEWIDIERRLPDGLWVTARQGQAGGVKLGDPILDGALRVECDDAQAARDLLADEHLRGALLALFCEHPSAEIAEGAVTLRYVVGAELYGYKRVVGALPFYTAERRADARRAVTELAEALETRPTRRAAIEERVEAAPQGVMKPATQKYQRA